MVVSDNCNFTVVQTPAAGTILTDGDYVIQTEVTDAPGNTIICSFGLKVEDTTLSIEDYELTGAQILLFPNPTATIVTLKNNSNSHLLSATIIDISGRVLSVTDFKRINCILPNSL